MRTRRLGLAALALLLGACAPAIKPSPTAAPTPVVLVDDVAVGGDQTLHIVCSGPADPAGPTIVFENGGGVPFGNWSNLVDELDGTHRACAYDRAGIGMSNGAPEPRTTRDQVNDLATLLEKVGLSGPIVIVAHSAGGWNAILYAADHPEQVVGAVLVDILPPGVDPAFLEVMGPETPGEPKAVHDFRVEIETFRSDPSKNPESLRIADSEELVLAAPGFGARPVEILWATNTDVTNWPGFDPDMAERLNAAYEAVRSNVEALADDPKVTRVDTGHFIHDEQPDVVLEAIQRVIDQVD